MFDITLWPNLTQVTTFTHHRWSWQDLVANLSGGISAHKKESVGLFGPYKITGPQRADTNVAAVSLAVFDVDNFTTASPLAELMWCRLLLDKAQLAQHWYTTYSHKADAPAWRLVLPLAEPCPANLWKNLRANLISTFAIPADAAKCSGLSHCYFLPSHPPDQPANEYLTIDGNTLSAVSHLATVPLVSATTRYTLPADWRPPDGGDPTDDKLLTKLRGYLYKRQRRLVDTDRRKDWLANAIAGRAIADHGERDNATCVVAAMVVFALPFNYSVDVCYALLAESVAAMVSRGSKLTPAKVQRMLLSAMANRARMIREEEEYALTMTQDIKSYMEGLPRAKS